MPEYGRLAPQAKPKLARDAISARRGPGDAPDRFETSARRPADA